MACAAVDEMRKEGARDIDGTPEIDFEDEIEVLWAHLEERERAARNAGVVVELVDDSKPVQDTCRIGRESRRVAYGEPPRSGRGPIGLDKGGGLCETDFVDIGNGKPR